MGNKKTIKAIFSSVLAFCFLTFSLSTPSLAMENNEQQVAEGVSVIKNGDYESNRFIVKYKSKVDKEALASVFDGKEESINAIRCKDGKYGVISTRLKSKSSEIYEKLKVKNLDKLIEYIQPDYSFELSSNDPYFDQQWGIQNPSVTEEVYGSSARVNIDANVVPAWEVAQGEGVIVAVADTGIDINHEDLKENIWVNGGEVPGNDIDDDGNGFIDDINGWNFYDDTADVSVYETVYGEDHGTHIAGIIAAVKDNGKGIAGVAPKAKILPLKVFQDGKAYTSDIIEAIDYTEKNGAKVFNCSWGSAYENPALKEAIEQSGMLFVCAAGNSGIDIDQNPVYPAAFTSDNVISVASLTRTGGLASSSNYGQISVDVAAPGEGIVSTVPGNGYGMKNGTSMAAALVSGEAALVISKNVNLATIGIKKKIINSSDGLSTLKKISNLSNEIKVNEIDTAGFMSYTRLNVTSLVYDSIYEANVDYQLSQDAVLLTETYAANPSGDILSLKVTNGNDGEPNSYYYMKCSGAQYTFQAGDYIEYDVKIQEDVGGAGGIECIITDGTGFRWLAGWNDQYGLPGAPWYDISSIAYGNWCHRKLAVPDAMIGKTSDQWALVGECDGQSFTYTSLYDNIVITNGSGVEKKIIFKSGNDYAGGMSITIPGILTVSNASAIVEIVIADDTLNLALTILNTGMLNKSFLVTYLTSELQLIDLCGLTSDIEIKAGNIEGTNITITQYTPGYITFIVDCIIPPGKSWSGVVNIIKFKKLVNTPNIIYKLQ